VFEARRLIEPATAMRAAARLDAAAAARLEAHVGDERAALAQGDVRAAIRLSGVFHMLVAGIAAHGVYADFLAELVARSSLILLLYRARGAHVCGTDHHAAIVGAIRAGDGPAAGRLMIEHLAEIENGLILDASPAPDGRLADILRF
jgi:DNA-binding GntR family transcriptional regulator